MFLQDIYTTIGKYIKQFVKGEGKVKSKLISDITYGVLVSKSVKLSEIVRGLSGRYTTSARYIYKRIDRGIGRYDTERVTERVKSYQMNMIDDRTLVYIDGSDVVKSYGRKFECMSRVADGSDERKLKNGYPLIGAIGLRGKEIIPLELKIYSHRSEDYISQNEEYFRVIEGLWGRSRNKGIYVLDRGFDEFAMIRKMSELEMKYIVRVGENRKYYREGQRLVSYSREEIIDRYKEIEVGTYLDVREKRSLKMRLFEISGVRVELLGGKIESKKPLWLIRAKSRNLTLYLLSNIEIINKETLVYIVKSYLSRWKIEEFFRFIKQEYKLERFMVRDMGRIRNLINLLYIAVVILCRISEFKVEVSRVRDILIKKSQRVYKIPQKLRFFLYMLGDGLSEVLKIIMKRIKQMLSKEKKVNKNQLRFSFAEDL